MRRSLFLVLLCLFVTQTVPAEEAEPTEAVGPAGTLRVGKNLTYKRGTAIAEEQLVKFPYTHTNNSRQCWGWVVHEGLGLRVYMNKDESEGIKSKSEDLMYEDLAMDHPFMKVVDQIKLDGLLNVYKELKKSKKLEDEDWQILGGDSAVHKKFFKNSQGRHYCIVAVHNPDTKKISQPIILSFKRSKQGPMASLVSPQGTLSSAAKPVNPNVNLGTHRVFKFLESRKGF